MTGSPLLASSRVSFVKLDGLLKVYWTIEVENFDYWLVNLVHVAREACALAMIDSIRFEEVVRFLLTESAIKPSTSSLCEKPDANPLWEYLCSVRKTCA